MSTYSAERVLKTWVGRWGKRTLKSRLFAKVFVDFETDCWLWTASTDDKGYGQFHVAGRPVKAHIVMFKVYGGVIPDGLTLDHLCRNIICVNPEHLEPTTRSENTLRQFAVGGHPRSAQTHCVNGHALAGDNLRRTSNPAHRRCRTCVNENNRRYRQRRKAVSA